MLIEYESDCIVGRNPHQIRHVPRVKSFVTFFGELHYNVSDCVLIHQFCFQASGILLSGSYHLMRIRQHGGHRFACDRRNEYIAQLQILRRVCLHIMLEIQFRFFVQREVN